MPSTDNKNRVSVVLCTYWPSDFLPAQLQSIARQTLQPTDVLVSDDSGDRAVEESIQRQLTEAGLKNTRVIAGPRRGFAANFLSALMRSDLKGDFFAFCDQDDIWLEDKLEAAITRLAQIPPDTPGLYCSRTLLVDEENNDIGPSAPCRSAPSFSNALVQSLAGGNTMVLNREARNLVVAAGQLEVVSHDWWVYMLVSGVGGQVIFDDTPRLRYRQHQSNVIGSNNSIAGQMVRVKMLFRNRFKDWNQRNISALENARHLLLPENQKQLDKFIAARSGLWFLRVLKLRKSGVYRQTKIGTIALFVATIVGKI
ncbi:glycosyltransferase [Marinobacter persicus]|uniref:Glycosyltransferase involved in cell wall biosynthesis n=1 Tax=Marinobacter persicus TaxID=930118 RepID=A0A2S6G2I3_9GAMM|nr:glycosyltransferase [Marinobacter persicus]PPK49975.1 glycosyltransferase involved in cell wall biosynthesis [Marinobacter persicus]PPK51890.1 glycosyltransferase involved in cell wall biosynthesis [Marinobacter persicus]PPK56557.1 glycosyltransferase involved in cell wall biosynthesis [Marinobacter persicus]